MKKTVEQQLKETVQSLRTKLVTEKSNLSEWEFTSPSSWFNGRGYGDATSRDDARKQDMSTAQINTLRNNASKIMPGIVTTIQDDRTKIWYGMDSSKRPIAMIINGEWVATGGQTQAAPSSGSGASGNPAPTGSTTPDPAKLDMFKQLLTKAGVYTPPTTSATSTSNSLLSPDAFNINSKNVFKKPIGTDFTFPMPEPAPMKTQEGFLRDALLNKLRLLEDAPTDPAASTAAAPPAAAKPVLTMPEFKLLSRLYGEFKTGFPNNPEIQALCAAYDKIPDSVWSSTGASTSSAVSQTPTTTAVAGDDGMHDKEPGWDTKTDSEKPNNRITKREYEKGTMGPGSRDNDSTSGPTGVTDLQTLLIAKEYLPKDHKDKPGVFGDATKAAVIKLQTALKSKGADLGPPGIDGVFGQATQAAASKLLGISVAQGSPVKTDTSTTTTTLFPPNEITPDMLKNVSTNPAYTRFKTVDEVDAEIARFKSRGYDMKLEANQLYIQALEARKTVLQQPPAVVADPTRSSGSSEMDKFKTVAEVDAEIKKIKDKGLDKGNSVMQEYIKALEARKSVLQAAGGVSGDPLASTVPGPGDSVLKYDAKYTDKEIPPRPTIGKPVGVGPGTNRPATQSDIDQWDKNWKMSHFADGHPFSGGDLQLSPDWATIDPGMAAILKGIKVKKVDGVWIGTERVKDPKSGDMKVARASAPQVIKALDELARKEATNMHPNVMQKESVGYVNDDLKRIVSLVHYK
jgi:hypothetical protein